MHNTEKKSKIALMSYSMDGRSAKGTALYTRKLIEGLLLESKFDFYLVHYDKVRDPTYQKAKEIIMPKINIPYGGRFISQFIFFWKYRNEPFDIVHWFQPRLYPFYWLIPAKKIVVTFHGAGDITATNSFVFSRSVFNFIAKYFNKWIDVVIVDSKNAAFEVSKYYNLPFGKIETIYLGGGENFKLINKEEAKNLVLKKYNINSQYILDVARLQPHKNIVTLIKAYGFMRDRYPGHNEILVIVGGAYDKTDEYTEAEKSNYSSSIKFINFVESEDLNSIYSASDLFVFPSLDEGFGLPVVEAMASGVPVITSNVTSMPEIGGTAVITVNPLNIEELAHNMHKVLTDRVLQAKMIELGLSRSREFTWGETVKQTEDLYNQITES